MKKLLIAILLIALIWWVFFRDDEASAPGIRVIESPQQTAVDKPSWTSRDYEIQPLARYKIKARVLGKKRYRFGDLSDIAPLDLALGWKGMSDTAILKHFSISQSSRWYEYYYDAACPLPANEIAEQSANVHCLPANADVMATLNDLRRNSFVELEGYLVEVRKPGLPPWRSSLVRDDVGGGSCEIFWIEEAIKTLP